ncbi:puratrophin-1 isoform x2 [Limosa lapponica baueri]|uniref:Puratrophin-1 isoform x2 n=1 Tax=Limosa lapponica baueri TaxID=1758121 RepID=A0A2I0T786_LIMLA|nr:puratrophin-1 isoform x2 [Limosa lapponica baueri]
MRHTLLPIRDLGIQSKSMRMTDICDETSLGEMSNNPKEEEEVQLASIDWRILKPGDFYLQVVPYLKKSPRIVLKCLAKDKHNVEEVVIPEVSYTSIFTLEWLSTINGERMGIALENCLLTTDEKIFRVPWDKVVNPEFINKPKIIENSIISPEITEEPSVLYLPMDHAESNSPDLGSQYLQEQSPNRDNLVINSTAPQLGETLVNGVCTSHVPQENLKSDLEGEYVELTEVSLPRFGPQTDSLTQSLALNYLTQPRTRVNASKGKHRFIVIQDRTYSKNLIQSALMQKEHCQMDTLGTSTEVLKNVVPLESNKVMARGELVPEGRLVSGGPGNMGNSIPVAESPPCGAEDSSAEQETRGEHSIDWRYALCSYSDVCASDGVNCKTQMPAAPGNVEGEGGGPSGNLGVETSGQSPETILDAAPAKEEEILRGRGEPLTEDQNEVTQMDPSPVSALGPSGPHCTLKESSNVSCQGVSEGVVPGQASTIVVVPESSDVGVERGSSSSGSTADVGTVGACCSDQEANLSSPLNPPEQNQEEVNEFEPGRRDSPEEVKESEQVLTVNENQTSHSHCSVKAPTDGLFSDGEEQEVSACQHKKAEEVLQTAVSAEGDQTAVQLNNSDSLMGLDAQTEGLSQFGTQSSGESCEEPQRQAENQGCKSEENSVLNPECVAVQDLKGGEENQGSLSYGEKSKAIALKTLESIEEELEFFANLRRYRTKLQGMVSEGAETRGEASGTDVLKTASKVSAPEEASTAITPPPSPAAWGGRSAPTIVKDVNPEVLRSGVACLPGWCQFHSLHSEPLQKHHFLNPLKFLDGKDRKQNFPLMKVMLTHSQEPQNVNQVCVSQKCQICGLIPVAQKGKSEGAANDGLVGLTSGLVETIET